MVFNLRKFVLICSAASAIMAIAVSASAGNSADVQSCRQFAQSFYSWYVPYTQKDLSRPAFEIALQQKTAVFAPELLRALRADAQAQRRAKGELVGIDFDPFVGSQDPADHYDTRKVTLQAHKCFVEVWRNSPRDKSAKSNKPDVVAELSNRTGQWQFENFRYPSDNGDLLKVLALSRKERSKRR